MDRVHRILVVDDEEPIRRGLSRTVTGLGHEVDVAADAEEALQLALAHAPDLVITDLNMPGRTGLELIEDLRDSGIEATVLVLTAHASIDSAIQATKKGVYDYLQKPIEPAVVESALIKALEHTAMRQEVLHLRRELQRQGRFQELVGDSPSMQQLYRMIDQIAPTNASVLITGESGTGKEVVARTIHGLSPRRSGRFVAINCAAIPENLLESEIFGHEKGSFTGATASRPGCFEHAHEGTLFLDEIGDMPAGLQTKLLRVLEDGKVRRVGGQREIPVDVRVLAATNVEIDERLASGRLREDLYFRLNVFTLHLPPLRERAQDVPVLASHFLHNFAEENGKKLLGISQEAMEQMTRYDWPGNVRELRNVMQRAAILCDNDEVQPHHLPPSVRPIVRRDPGSRDALSVKVGTPLEEVEKAVILETLEACAGNKTRAASVLGITTKTLYAKLRRYGRLQATEVLR
ncbi:MAG: sigma-54-dependent Fis family transcriptional regulator [Candidatus Eisenbacteria bacterium]|uniref:Sigma-54-dependent Fis family transcriptional regulator n=1 Tax=Eiseniibacteriota bacterium TaxID=2212470 RepID=A0A956N9K8_UNCEI|nr:sigma-54-dependent Fis family transcriptional regulator [Candidatus Eisenbacteria bacterium]MCB9465790.1 sigma-54-dependent Fis family transcriptional regulator [Candidatus Eisenbacteria bacterium]